MGSKVVENVAREEVLLLLLRVVVAVRIFNPGQRRAAKELGGARARLLGMGGSVVNSRMSLSS